MFINKRIKKPKFTVIELLAAMTIVIILMSITVGVFTYVNTKTKNDKTKALIKKIEMAMRSYKHDTGYYVQQPALGSLTINTSNPEFLEHINYSGMISTDEINGAGLLVDAWGNPILYECPGSHNNTMFDLISFGKNGVNNDGSVDDITNYTSN